MLPPFSGPIYTVAQLLTLCPLKPTRSSLPFPASVTELFDQVTIDMAVKCDPLSPHRTAANESEDYELLRPALKMKLSQEDQQVRRKDAKDMLSYSLVSMTRFFYCV